MARSVQDSVCGSSPLTRGKRGHPGLAAHYPGLIPAHAGKTSCGTGSSRASEAHPRSRGENFTLCIVSLHESGSSPLTRGKPRGIDTREFEGRLIPAHAGKTAIYAVTTTGFTAHPRSRGEN